MRQLLLFILGLALGALTYGLLSGFRRPAALSLDRRDVSGLTLEREEALADVLASCLNSQHFMPRMKGEQQCEMLHEFRCMSIFLPILHDKICVNGFQPCQLQTHFDEVLASLVRRHSDVAQMQSYTNESVEIFVFKEKDIISNSIRRWRKWKPELAQWILKFSFNLPEVTFLDIGSNIGVFSIQAAKLGLPVVSLDADLRNLLRLHLSLQASSLNATLVWNSVSDKQDPVFLNFRNDCKVSLDGRKDEVDLLGSISVLPVRSDTLWNLIKTKTVVLKLDLRGNDFEFLSCSVGLFTKFSVAAVQMDWWNPVYSLREVQLAVDVFLRLGFSCWRIHGFEPLDPRTPGMWGYTEVVWIHRDFLNYI